MIEALHHPTRGCELLLHHVHPPLAPHLAPALAQEGARSMPSPVPAGGSAAGSFDPGNTRRRCPALVLAAIRVGSHSGHGHTDVSSLLSTSHCSPSGQDTRRRFSYRVCACTRRAPAVLTAPWSIHTVVAQGKKSSLGSWWLVHGISSPAPHLHSSDTLTAALSTGSRIWPMDDSEGTRPCSVSPSQRSSVTSVTSQGTQQPRSSAERLS